MVNFINSWAHGIILAVIIATLIEIILPEGNNKKYVKTIIGIYILFVMVYPLISKISSKNVDIQNIIETTTTQINEHSINNEVTIETNSYIEETYKKKIEEDINKKIQEKGYQLESANIKIETQSEESYGQIDSMNIKVSKKEDNKEKASSNIVNKIENVEIKISNSNTTNKVQETEISQQEIETLKNYLSTSYEVSKEKININE